MAFTYTGENVQETPQYKLPPIDDYTVKIMKGEEKISKTGKSMICLNAKIQHKDYHNELFEYIVDDEYAQQKIFNICTALGIPVTKGMPVTPQLFVGKTGTVRIKHDQYNGETNARIHYWKKPAETHSSPASSSPASSVTPDDIPF